MNCLGPFQDAAVADVVARIETAFSEVAAARHIDEADLRSWVAWVATRPLSDEEQNVVA